jgi:hypothetical protein
MPALVRCGVCLHPDAREIDNWLLNAQGKRQPRSKISRQFGLSEVSLGRHMAKGHWRSAERWSMMGGKAPVTVEERKSGAGVVMDGVGQLETLLADMVSKDTSNYSPRDLNIHNDQLRKVAADVARHKPPADREGPATEQLKALMGMMEVYDRVLDGHPEIREELAQALMDWKARR